MIFLLQAICLPDRISWNLRFGGWRKNWESKLPLKNCSLLAGTWRRAFPAFTESPGTYHELSAVYVLYRDVEPEKLHLQEEEVESVRWMEYEECLRRIQDGTLVRSISLDEFKMLGDFLSGQGSKNECHAHPGQK